MICDKIIFDSETIITIYHSGFSDEKSTKRKKISDTIDCKEITFLEYYESSDKALNGENLFEEGFLDQNIMFIEMAQIVQSINDFQEIYLAQFMIWQRIRQN